jgi:F-type H+-transporting ATPase subunit b
VINLNIALVIQIVNVLLLLVILQFFLFRPLRKVLAERKAAVDGDRGTAARLEKDVQEKVNQYESRLKEIKIKASEEKGALVKAAHQEESSILEKARGEASETLSTIKNKIAKEASDAKTLLKEQAQSLSRDITEKVLGRSL